ncbi:P6 [Pseudomonas phage phi8]|uniref:p6 n=1 Tax=Pseudomonas phage phi8 TaxID=120086 RepID=Q9MC11_9VIRU|nr:membrane protein [Pseudomonas phage phi8]AAF63304.1 P6 [Pseudomonas phage phi8]
MGSALKSIKRFLAKVLVIIALVLVAIAVIYWNSDSIGFLGKIADSTGIAGIGLLGPGQLLMIAGLIGVLAFFIDSEAAGEVLSAVSDIAKGIATGVTEVVSGAAKSLLSSPLGLLLGGVAAFAVYRFVSKDENTITVKGASNAD